MPDPDALRFERALAEIEPAKIGDLCFRVVPIQYAHQPDSVEGALLNGGRFNPPKRLAGNLCNLPEGFAFLYTASNPITCLFECGHILRGSGRGLQIKNVQPTVLVSFEIEADDALDLRNPTIQQTLGISETELTSVDVRYKLNSRGSLTRLQKLGFAVCQSKRFSAIVTPSRFSDVIESYCLDFLPSQVKLGLQDTHQYLSKLTPPATPKSP